MLTSGMFHGLWPHMRPALLERILAQQDLVLAGVSPLVLAHFMGQVSEECGADQEGVENLSYSTKRLIEVWPRHFNAENASAYAHNPRKLADFIYEPPQHTDLGNRAGTDDGWRYRGMGGTQTTGRDTYTKLGVDVGLDLVNYPELVNEPEHWLVCSWTDFKVCGCVTPALKNDVHGVTVALNGGTVGLQERKIWTARWKRVLKVEK